MAIRLRVQENNAVKLNASGGDAARFNLTGLVQVVEADYYEGQTTVTPTQQTQTLLTADKTMRTNVTINPIPSNYGLITWNGSYLTVS